MTTLRTSDHDNIFPRGSLLAPRTPYVGDHRASPRLPSVTESHALPPRQKAASMSNTLQSNTLQSSSPSSTSKFSIREWLVPPLLVPLFFGLVIIVAVLVQW
ncbi:hypothetical protein SSBR45G_60670 [Bradyrhizobium sp. SSBR45G]|uniref:hypothetical protein n=1 Tax=Bradyrhizobium sp. SSBR45R TaxID=2996007 RepID=UPI0023429196|nr:hypothetical protein [Bradyrhizobium sp. SSBR45R]GLH81158.1 hypothetical protein SSBR45G_60670 [Bradyrhizobium sp. SSBR45G]GLH88559.1 hypothetical protein SSBR45R_60200 [Bradyrhizobium sp. SSBR45R]